MLKILVFLIVATVYLVITNVKLDSGGRSGKQILLILLSPVALGVGLNYLWIGLRQVWDGLTRFEVGAEELIIHRPLTRRVIPWLFVHDFLLLAAEFADPPETLILLGTLGRPVRLPLERFNDEPIRARLVASVPGLTDWGLQHVRTPLAVCKSSRRVRWEMLKPGLPKTCAAALFALLFVAAPLAMGWGYINYLRIERHHTTVSAEITAITGSADKDSSVHARVQYFGLDGKMHHQQRSVSQDFFERFKVGDHVDVDYLVGQPTVMRIPKYDLDSRQWVLMILVLPIGWISLRRIITGIGSILRPLHESLIWLVMPRIPPMVAFSEARLEMLAGMLPEEHRGAIILKIDARSKVSGVDRRLSKSDLDVRILPNKFNILDPRNTQRLFQRLDPDGNKSPGYMMVDCPTTAEAERLILEHRANPDSAERGPIRFACSNQMCGPLDDARKRALFQSWLTNRLTRLYGGALPADVAVPDFAVLLNVDPANAIFALLIERRTSGPRLWIRDDNNPKAQRAECTNGRWIVSQNVPAPRTLKSPTFKRALSRIRRSSMRR